MQAARTVDAAAFEAANEGRRLLACERLSVVVRRGRRWRLASTSGVDRVGRRTDFARLTERLAGEAARWGEPFIHPDPAGEAELPPRVAGALAEHVDHSHARSLACVPAATARAQPASDEADRSRRQARDVDAVFIAERFDAAGEPGWQQQLVELADLCGPALRRAAELDRFPLRPLLRWSAAWPAAAAPGRLVRRLALLAALVGAVAALVFVPADFDVEAAGRLATAVERDVFAAATGAVDEVRVVHGQEVQAGDVLAVLRDPALALEIQQTRGELETVRNRLNALAVTRTDRALREQTTDDRLPLAAEQRQLEERRATLEGQLKLLDERRETLTIRSPIAGQVLTRDVQTLLESRPVERGQVLLTIADTTSGWQIVAEAPQRSVGHVLDAQRGQSGRLQASYRLAGDVERSYPGEVTEVSAAAALDAEGLQDDEAPIEIRIAALGEAPAAARPGMSARVRIHCGERSLGYVWLHDVGATLYRWATF
jgi:multidrug efflux pump subunit AcrA (membrane-fusion protein)